MTLYVDLMYARRLGMQLKGFTEKTYGKLFNFSCPLCGDSAKKSNKKRGYLIEKKDRLNFFCHNCSVSMPFGKFLKSQDPNMFNQYSLENYKKPPQKEQIPDSSFLVTLPKEETEISNVISGLKAIDELPRHHAARKYVEDRQIPEEFWMRMFYAQRFTRWASKNTDSITEHSQDHPRIIIPWYSNQGKIFSYSARAFGKEQPKYYNIVLDQDVPKFFGEERLDDTKPMFVVEGPVDSMFIQNSIAVGNASIGKYRNESADVTYIPDRDTRNPQVMKIVKHLIDDGLKVCLLPHNIKGKDINEMWLMNFWNRDRMMKVITENTFQGLTADLRFAAWNKT